MPGRACSLCHEPGHRRDRCPHAATSTSDVGRWYLELMAGSVARGVTTPMGRAPSLEEAMAMAAQVDGGKLEWDQPHYFDGWTAVGRRGVWLLQERDSLPVTTSATRSAWDRRHRAAAH